MDKLPPNSTEAEQAVLGALMVDNTLVDEICDIITGDDFYNPGHRIIFNTIMQLSAKHTPMDLVSVPETLKHAGALENLGGYSYVAALLDAIPTTANVKYYANIVKEMAIKRRLIQLGRKIRDLGYVNKPPEDLISEANVLYNELLSSDHAVHSRMTSDVLFERVKEKIPLRLIPRIGLSTGFEDLDIITGGWKNSELIIVAARPSIGKTAFILNSMLWSWKYIKQPLTGKFLFYSLEQSLEQLALRCVSMFYNKEVSALDLQRGGLTEHIRAEVFKVIDNLRQLPAIWYDEPNRSIHHFLRIARKECRNNKIEAIIIDHVGQLTYPGLENQQTTEAFQIMATLQSLRKELNVPIICLHQLNRGVEARQDKRPTLSDLRQTGNSEQTADVVISLYRDEYYNKQTEKPGVMEVHILKGRDCPIGNIALNFNKYTLAIFNPKDRQNYEKEEEFEEYETPY
ncbi:MAG: replicative DNA helicase [Gammaproteobacteria bacterium]|uniref:DNA 5'-3' helicase n=1 Tax=viral metagenome TaxID=1070528 RepID=A0A6M3JQL7_9ZZZZ|nr:replicative DNA helicase [Gammaproteobacteria bacterium]